MAKAKVTHSDDAVTIEFRGNPQIPEPSTAIIKFPGGYVEVARTTGNEYWAHIQVHQLNDASSPGIITDSRIDYEFETYVDLRGLIPEVPRADKLQHIALRIKRGS